MPNYNQTLQTNNSSLEEIITQLNNMPDAGSGGIDTSDATADAGDILSGKTAYVDGEKITGTITTKTSSNLTASGATVTVPSGYYSATATKSVTTATQATPTITVNSSTGLITATATQTAGYVVAGTKSGTKQLAFQAAQTITPGTTNKTIAANTYLGGVQTIKGDANLVPSNIVSGKSIFGVVGTATAGGGEDPFDSSPFAYTVDAISGAQYGFALNANGYYESQNKGIKSSYAICRINLTVTKTCDITFDVINYAESSYDYAIIGNMDVALSLSASADSSYKKSFKGLQSADVVNVTYSGVTAGTHYIDIKFIKDGSQDSNNDSVQFKIQEQGGLSQDTINKILAADTDLVAENIKSGVDIFGVIGTYAGTGGSGGGEVTEYSEAEDSIISRTISGTYTNDRVTLVGNGAFDTCESLTSVNFPSCSIIGSYAFNECTGLTSISFPVCTSIGNEAFYRCAITSANFPSCTAIGQYAFYYCWKLASISFPVCISIGTSAFIGCAITSANFPLCTSIGQSAFYNCTGLTSISFPVCTSIGVYAFGNCRKLTSISFPVCTSIGQSAFRGCSALTTVSFPVCKAIGSYAFYFCSKLTTASFPVCSYIGTYAFSCCTNLSQIYLTNSSICTLANSNAFSSTAIGSTKGSIFVPTSLVDSYKSATNWTYFSNRIFGV